MANKKKKKAEHKSGRGEFSGNTIRSTVTTPGRRLMIDSLRDMSMYRLVGMSNCEGLGRGDCIKGSH